MSEETALRNLLRSVEDQIVFNEKFETWCQTEGFPNESELFRKICEIWFIEGMLRGVKLGLSTLKQNMITPTTNRKGGE